MRATIVAATLWAAAVSAGGFALSEQDAAATGRGGTAIAATPSASAIHYNPAALALLRGPAATLGINAILPSVRVVDPSTLATSHTAVALKAPPHVYAAWAIGKTGFGLGFNAPFGGGVKWHEDWRGRYELTEMNFQVLAFHAGLAYALTPEWSFGATAHLYSATIGIDRLMDFVSVDARASLTGSGLGFGGTVGATWTPDSMGPLKRAGLVVRTPTTVGLKGQARFQNVPLAFSGMAFDQGIKSSMNLPAKVALGTEWLAGSTRLYGEAELTFWSSFKTFSIDFESDATPDVNQPRNWTTAPTFRLGLEHEILGLTGRAGAALDLATSPSDTLSPSSPDSNRLGASLGLGKAFGPFRADAAYMLIAFLPRAATGEAFPAEYSAMGHVFAVTAAYKY